MQEQQHEGAGCLMALTAATLRVRCVDRGRGVVASTTRLFLELRNRPNRRKWVQTEGVLFEERVSGFLDFWPNKKNRAQQRIVTGWWRSELGRWEDWEKAY
jgi:hypothetical protein